MEHGLGPIKVVGTSVRGNILLGEFQELGFLYIPKSHYYNVYVADFGPEIKVPYTGDLNKDSNEIKKAIEKLSKGESS